MKELALHILDIAENSVAAQAHTIEINVVENSREDRLKIAIQDDGVGMDAEMVVRVVDPFVTSRTTRKVGLGIPLLKAAAEACDGGLTITSQPGQGTRVEVAFQLSHIDRMPLGDIAGTILTLIVSFPAIHWRFKYRVDDETFSLDDADIKAELADVPLTEPAVLTFIREYLESGVASVRPAPVR